MYSWIEDLSGLRIEEGDAFPLDPLAWSDLDGDGCPTASDTGLSIDNHPEDPMRCDEALDFDLPAQLNLDAIGSDGIWTISVDWKSTMESTESVSIYGLSWNSSDGMQDQLLNIEPPGAIAWWTENEPDNTPLNAMFERTKGVNHDRLMLRLISTSRDGQSLEYWTNFTYVSELPIEDPEPICAEGDTRSVGDGCNDCVCVIGPEGGDWDCTEKACSPSVDASSNEGLSMVAWSGIIIGLLAIVVTGLALMRRKGGTQSTTNDTVPRQHPPCPTCGGPAQETVNNGNKWTWCPSCRQWLDYIGKSD